jgi:hypothetical protein
MEVVEYLTLCLVVAGSAAWLLCELERNLSEAARDDESALWTHPPVPRWLRRGSADDPADLDPSEWEQTLPARPHQLLLPPCPTLDRRRLPTFVDRRTSPGVTSDPRRRTRPRRSRRHRVAA